MSIQHEDDIKNGRFFILEASELLAEMTYVWAGSTRFIIDHTEVSEKLKGQNAGKQLVARAVGFAREKGVKILPLCPFAKSVFDKMSEYRDVL